MVKKLVENNNYNNNHNKVLIAERAIMRRRSSNENNNDNINYNDSTLFRMGFYWAVHGWGAGKKPPP